jgi:hypothetical protein
MRVGGCSLYMAILNLRSEPPLDSHKVLYYLADREQCGKILISTPDVSEREFLMTIA